MGFKFRQRIKIAPGIHINIGKTGITSASIGKAGATLNVGKKGVKATAGIPGTGLSYTSGNLLAGQKNSTGKHAENVEEQAPERLGFFSDSTLLEDGQEDIQPPRPLVMVLTHKQFRKLSTEEKTAFKNAGEVFNRRENFYSHSHYFCSWLAFRSSPTRKNQFQRNARSKIFS